MKYVDAGYVVALAVLALYAVGLVLRRRRLLRAVAMSAPPSPAAQPVKGAQPMDAQVTGAPMAQGTPGSEPGTVEPGTVEPATVEPAGVEPAGHHTGAGGPSRVANLPGS